MEIYIYRDSKEGLIGYKNSDGRFVPLHIVQDIFKLNVKDITSLKIDPKLGYHIIQLQTSDKILTFRLISITPFSGGGGGSRQNTGISGITVEDEGTALPGTYTILNFIGDNVDVTNAGGGQANITITETGNVETLVYTIGVPGKAGVDYNFSSLANMNKQTIQLGLTDIIPQNSPISIIVSKCTETVNGGTQAISDVGDSSGGNEWMSSIDLSAADDIESVSTQVKAKSAVSSIYFSITPDANWDTLSDGTWKVWITIFNNSTN